MKRTTFLGAAAIVAMGAQIASAADVSATLDLASAYVFRGVTFNDGLVAQPGLEVGSAFGGGVSYTLGVWGNIDIDDYDDTLEDGQFSEIDIYASLGIPMPEGAELLSLDLGYCEYTYPSGGGDADREISASFGLDVIAAPYLAAYYGVDGGIDQTLYLEAGVGHEMEITDTGLGLELGALIGYLDPDGGESGFSHYDLSAGISWEFLSASVTYVGQIDDDVLPDGAGSYDAEVVGMIGVGADF